MSLETSLGLPASEQPLTRDAALALKADRMGNPQWCENYLAGNAAERSEMQKITTAIAATTPIVEVSTDALAAHEKEAESAIVYLNASGGLTDEIAKQINDPNRKVSYREYQAAKVWKAARMNDAAWRDRYLNGDVAAVRELTLASIILSSAVEG